MMRPLPGLLLLLLLGACANLEPAYYKPANGGVGYSEEQVAPGIYRVSFLGNSITPQSTVQSYALYRAAEITVSLGFSQFALFDRALERDVERHYPGGYGYGYGYGYPFYDPYPYYGYYPYYGRYRRRPWGYYPGPPPPPVEVTHFEARLTIQPFAGDPPPDTVTVYDARQVLQSLGPQIRRPASG